MLEKIFNTSSCPNMEEQIKAILKRKKPIYIFGGLGPMSLGSVIANFLRKRNIHLEGFIANQKFINADQYMEKPILALEDCSIDRDASIIIGISKWKLAQEELLKFNFQHIFLFDSFSEEVLEPISLNYFKENYSNFYSTYETLEDRLSQDSMIAYLQGKIFNNYELLAQTCSQNTIGGGAYFDSPISFNDHEIMIDCGAFIGDTALAFVHHCMNYQKIYAIEPDPHSYKLLEQNTKHLKIQTFQKGVSSTACTLSFSVQENGCSNLTHQGSLQIQTMTIDSLLKIESSPITFIKMDIEGAELEALKGAKTVIERYKPKLAICVYHKKNDLIEIPKFIKSIHPDYKIYIRNHQMIPEDTVLYAI